MRIKSKIWGVLLLSMVIFACSENRLKVDVSNIEVDINYYDIDAKMFKKTVNEVDSTHYALDKQLTDLYFLELNFNLRQILQKNVRLDTLAGMSIHHFYSQDFISDIEEEKKRFFNQETLKEEINTGFKYFKYHFKEEKTPVEILWMNNLFANVHSSDSAMTIGLEYYLGPENAIIQKIPSDQLYTWQRKFMKDKYIARDVIQSWIQANLFAPPSGNLVESIIHAGKVLYTVNACFPEDKPTTILKYTEDEFKYVQENEGKFWRYLVDQNLLFVDNERDKANFLNEGPYTVGLPEDSPDRMGQFLGWQMVKSFMEQNENVTLLELIELDYNKILQSYDTK